MTPSQWLLLPWLDHELPVTDTYGSSVLKSVVVVEWSVLGAADSERKGAAPGFAASLYVLSLARCCGPITMIRTSNSLHQPKLNVNSLTSSSTSCSSTALSQVMLRVFTKLSQVRPERAGAAALSYSLGRPSHLANKAMAWSQYLQCPWQQSCIRNATRSDSAGKVAL